MRTLYYYLANAQRLQTTCFGTPINLTIEIDNDADKKKKGFMVSTFIQQGDKRSYKDTYVFSSDASEELTSQKWGKLKDDVNKLLDRYVGKKVNRRGREIQG